jgi:uncharacterized cupin superfamily protein
VIPEREVCRVAERRFLVKADEIDERASGVSHPWNPNSEIVGTRLGALVGLSRIGVNRARVPAGKESFIYHSHYTEEEWIYIISGRGVAEIDGEEYEVGAGDFMGFPAPGVAHHLRNPYDEDLVYLVGGENHEVDIADFPHLGKRMIRRGQNVEIYDTSDAKGFGPLEGEVGTDRGDTSNPS